MKRRITRLAIVNRGEAAVRLIHAVREMNAELSSKAPIHLVAFHTSAEADAMFVREADQAFDLGPASKRPYLDLDVLANALHETSVDAVWVGWGFVAEDPAFVELCDAMDITFVGPSAQAMRLLGDKIEAKLLAQEAGVPVAPWSGGPVDDVEDAVAIAQRLGFPLMLKSSAGGGGRGIHQVTCVDDLRDAFDRTRGEALRAFGSEVVFLESLITAARHIEVQVISDGATAWALGVRDCSIQRRNQKLIEESSSPLLTHERAADLKRSAERLAARVGYCGACTVEFLYQPATGSFAFLEVNTRLQVEHPVTELVTRTDLVKLQLHVAQGGTLSGNQPAEIGHAVEARLNAEDPERDFAPSPGRILALTLPQGPGIRVDTGVAVGDTIPPDFDSMIAKIVAYGASRQEALNRLRRALQDTAAIVEGGATNKSFLLALLDQGELVDGNPAWADTGWIDHARSTGLLKATSHSGAALVAGGITAYLAAEELERAELFDTAHRGRPLATHQCQRPVALKLRDNVFNVCALRLGPHSFRISISTAERTRAVIARFYETGTYTARLELGGISHRVLLAPSGPIQIIEVDGHAHRLSRDEGGVIRAQAPALVVATPVEEGAFVETGECIAVLESMKMESLALAPFSAVLRKVLVRVGSQVEAGTTIALLEPRDDDHSEAIEGSANSLSLPPDSLSAGSPEQLQEDLLSVILGFDNDDPEPLISSYSAMRAEREATLHRECSILDAFADIAEIHSDHLIDASSRGPFVGTDTDNTIHTSREYFHSYLRTLDPDRSNLPPWFTQQLLRALIHYDVPSLQRSPELHEAVFRLFLVQQNYEPSLTVVQSILKGWVDSRRTDTLPASARATLDRVIKASQRRFPIIEDTARDIRYKWFDLPSLEAECDASLARVPELLQEMSILPIGDERERVSSELVAASDRLVGFLFTHTDTGVQGSLLEVLALRLYEGMSAQLGSLHILDGRAYFTVECSAQGRVTRLASMFASLDDLRPGSVLDHAGTRLVESQNQGDDCVIDIYLHRGQGTLNELSDHIVRHLGRFAWFHYIQRLTVCVASQDGSSTYLTFQSRRGIAEENLVKRGIHPMLDQQLNLWRLSEFDLIRLKAPEGVLLFKGVAKKSLQDERLFALGQVRLPGFVLDCEGRIVAAPHLERVLGFAAESIRRERATATQETRANLHRNHVWIKTWGSLDSEITEDHLRSIGHYIAPLAADAGIHEVAIEFRSWNPAAKNITKHVARFTNNPGCGLRIEIAEPPHAPLCSAGRYEELVARAKSRGFVLPYELFELTSGHNGSAKELDLNEGGSLQYTDRPPGENTCGIVVADVSTPTQLHPRGVRRIILFGDPLKSLGAIGPDEADRIVAALNLAEREEIPVDWFALSSGARISMTSGTENMDAVARALKRIVEFTQNGGSINIIVTGINVGAQPYWNAEATMLMHTRGILIMTPDSAMVLTGKQSLDVSGGVSAEDNFGIGGYDRIMGPNGQAQYWAPSLTAAQDLLMRHYEHSYIDSVDGHVPLIPTADVSTRDIGQYPHVMEGSDFTTVGDIFSSAKNPERKKPFEIRTVMRALGDQDHAPLERWAGMSQAETAVVFDTCIGGEPVTLVGIESKPIQRRGDLAADGPTQFTAGTLFPNSSKKVARAINSSSGIRPVVVLANLSGFDGSPESMRALQLEYGAEIGRSVVNFSGPIVFVVINRYHGGAFVVFSKALNKNMTVLALEGSYASVIGGAPAAAVVFAREVERRVEANPKVVEGQRRVTEASDSGRGTLLLALTETRKDVRAEVISTLAAEFDAIHSVQRAVEVGSIDEVVSVSDLRPRVIEILRQARGERL